MSANNAEEENADDDVCDVMGMMLVLLLLFILAFQTVPYIIILPNE